MEEGSLHTDGNAIGGMLAEVFVAEVTAAGRVCQSCGLDSQIGAHRLYTSMGWTTSYVTESWHRDVPVSDPVSGPATP